MSLIILLPIFILATVIVPPIVQSGLLNDLKIFKRLEWKRNIKKVYKDYMSNNNGHATTWYPLRYKNLNDWYHNESYKYGQRVVDMPQLTFKSWLTFYNNNPEAWIIETIEDRDFADIPYYVRKSTYEDKRGKEKEKLTFVPIFWTNADEMYKYRKWVEEEYQIGKARIYSQRQEDNFKQLVTFIEDDIKEQHAKVEADLEAMRQSIVDHSSDEKREIKLTLEPNKEKEIDPNAVRTATPMPQNDLYITPSTSYPPIKLQSYINGDLVEELPGYGWEYYDCGNYVKGNIYYSHETGNIYTMVNGRLEQIAHTLTQELPEQLNFYAPVKSYY